MKRLILLGLLLILSSSAFSQSKFFISGEFIYGFNSSEVQLGDLETSNGNSIGYGIGAYYQYYLNDKYFVKTGLDFTNDFAKGTVADFEVEAVRYLLNIPVIFGVKFYDKWEVGTGLSFSPLNKVHQFHKESDNLIMTNFNLELAYWISEKFRVELSYSKTISEKYNDDVAITFYEPFKLSFSYNIF